MKKSFVIGKPVAKRQLLAALCLALLSVNPLLAESAPVSSTSARSPTPVVAKKPQLAPRRATAQSAMPHKLRSSVAAQHPANHKTKLTTAKSAEKKSLRATSSKTAQVSKSQAGKTKTPSHQSLAKSSRPNLRSPVTSSVVAPISPALAKPAKEWGLNIHSSSALVYDQATGKILYEKDSRKIMPIASITKLMTAMVVLDAQPNLNEYLTIGAEDVDTLRNSRSRLPVGTALSRHELLRLALMSSENRAASLLARAYPGGKRAFVAAMNRKAQALGLHHTHFDDSTGLHATNVSSARDLARMVAAASQYSLIRELTTTPSHQVKVGQHVLQFNNTNALVRNPQWRISVSKTGFINESGKCLVMQTWINDKPTIIVLLDSWGKLTPIGDSQRIRQWIEASAWDNTSAQGG